MNSKEAKRVSIVSFLEKNWFRYLKKRGNDYWYLSPYRKEKTPSFKVNSLKNLWYDFWVWEGGNIIDLVIKLFNCSVKEALDILADSSSFVPYYWLEVKKEDVSKEYKILSVWEINDKNLMDYLLFRKIDLDIAWNYLKEIFYSYKDRNYKILWFENSVGGYEVRNRVFKGTLLKKWISFLKGSKQSWELIVFEWFFDFLSALVIFKKKRFKQDVIVLNSVSLVRDIFKFLPSYGKIFMFMDNDKGGLAAKNLIVSSFGWEVVDYSFFYRGFKDLNEYLMCKR